MICRCSVPGALHRLRELIRSDVINSSLLEVLALGYYTNNGGMQIFVIMVSMIFSNNHSRVKKSSFLSQIDLVSGLYKCT